MNTEFIAEWTAELRSGNRQQGRGRLHEVLEDGTEAFCCLGVVEDMLYQRGLSTRKLWERDEEDERPSCYAYTEGGEEETGVLTDKAREYVGFEDGQFNPDIRLPGVVDSLAELNDDGLTFDQIADVIDYAFGGK